VVMVRQMPRRLWWMTLVRGTVGVTVGAMLLVWPQKSAEALLMLVGAFAVLTGALAIAHAAAARYRVWPASLSGGLMTVALGLIAWLWPDVTATILVYAVAVWALLFGLVELIAASAIARMGIDESLPRALGIISIIFSMLLLVRPGAGVIAAMWLIGIYLLATGGVLVHYAIRLRSATHLRPGP